MGLFNRKKNANQPVGDNAGAVAGNAPVQFAAPPARAGWGSRNGKNKRKRKDGDIVCPYCFHEFNANQVHFRAEASDEVEEDQYLKRFYTEFKHTNYPCVVKKAYDPAVSPGTPIYKTIMSSEGKKIKLLDQFIPANTNIPAKTRICPHCHNKLPQTAGSGVTKVIAVIGSTQIGKTVFINSLISELKNVNRKFNNFTFGFENPEMLQDFREQKRAIELGEIVASNRGYIRPIICTLYNNVTNSTTVISFYDFPGESTPEDIVKYSQDQFQHADGLILLFDLTRTKSLFDACKRNNIRELQESINAVYMGMGFSPDQYQLLSTLNTNVPDVKNIKTMLDAATAEKQKLARQVADSSGIMQDRLRSQLAEKEQREQALRVQYEQQLAQVQAFSENIKNIVGKELTANEIAALKSVNDTKNQINRMRADRIDNQMTALDWLTTIYNSAFAAADINAKDERPVAFVGTKSDEIYRAAQYGCINDEILVRNAYLLAQNNNKMMNVLDLRQVDAIDAFVRYQLLSRQDGDLTSYVNGKFENFKFFAVSALGTRYVDKIVLDERGNKKAIKQLDGYEYITYQNDVVDPVTGEHRTETVTELDGEIAPWRVDEPMFWVLNQFGIINGQ